MWSISYVVLLVFFFKQKTAYEMRISDWSSDVCSSDLGQVLAVHLHGLERAPALGKRVAAAAGDDRAQQGLAIGGQKAGRRGHQAPMKIGRASCRERVCQYV